MEATYGALGNQSPPDSMASHKVTNIVKSDSPQPVLYIGPCYFFPGLCFSAEDLRKA